MRDMAGILISLSSSGTAAGRRRGQRRVAVRLGESIAPWRAVPRVVPTEQPRAIDAARFGDDLLTATRQEVRPLRAPCP